MRKCVSARTHPSLTQLLMGKGSREEPSCWTVPLISSWKEVIILRILERQPILCRNVNRPDLLTRTKALVRCIKAMYRGRLCSRHFSCSCLWAAQNPYCASGYTRSANDCSLFSMTRAKVLPTILWCIKALS